MGGSSRTGEEVKDDVIRVSQVSNTDDIILDFFSGSSRTGEEVKDDVIRVRHLGN